MTRGAPRLLRSGAVLVCALPALPLWIPSDMSGTGGEELTGELGLQLGVNPSWLDEPFPAQQDYTVFGMYFFRVYPHLYYSVAGWW